MNMGIFKRLEVLYEKHFEIVVFKDNGKGYQKFFFIVGCSSIAAFAVCKKLCKQEL